ncbi:MAG: hypothetical protein ACHP65_09330 [Legionellales bacterium]
MNRFRHQPMRLLLPFLLATTLTACVDLSGTVVSSTKKAQLHAPHATTKVLKDKNKPDWKGEVHAMRGGLGIFSIGMNQLQVAVAERYQVRSTSCMWYNAGELSRSIVNHHYKYNSHRPIILIGHSLGANEQIKVARNLQKAGIPVALLVTVDAVAPNRVPANVKEVLNVYKPGFVPMFSGLRLEAVNPNTTHIENINVTTLNGAKVNHFTIDKDTVVQAMILDKIEKALTDANKKAA